MPPAMTIAAIIVAAGKGERAGGSCPKQFANLAGRPMVTHSIAAFADHPQISQIILVVGAGQEAMARDAVGSLPVDAIVIGGAERQESVHAGLMAAKDAQFVLVHDAARPFLAAHVIDRLIAALETEEAAVPVLPVVDTLARGTNALGPVVDRSGLMRIQTPQAFCRSTLVKAHEAWGAGPATDDAQMVRALGICVAQVAGDKMLEKVTLPEDFAEAEARLAARLVTRTGVGFDVHRLADGEDLWLGGIKIDHSQGLAGHSDADVALHALTDALLGALGDGDIGTHFPPSDPQWRGARSDQFVRHAAQLIRAASGHIDHVDVTLICEAPKIGPHRPAMRTAIAAMLGISETSVSVKATTTERLGFTGRGEGIAAQAIATIRMPVE